MWFLPDQRVHHIPVFWFPAIPAGMTVVLGRAVNGYEVVKSTCPYCGVGCGLLVERYAGGEWLIKGDPEHPSNQGRLCSKGTALGEILSLHGRLLHPEVDGERVSWDRAIDEVVGRFGEIIAEHGPDAVGRRPTRRR